MSEGESTFLFVRHAESEKNQRDITGGAGEPLTEVGVHQAVALANRLRTELNAERNITVFSSSAIQSQQTASEIAQALSLHYGVSDALSPLRLGIADGLSGAQISQLYPDVYARLSSWRKREIEAIDLNIPGMEIPARFWVRIVGFLNEHGIGSTEIVVCTRSVMVLIANLVSGKRPQKGGGYKHYSIRNCDVIAFTYQIGEKSIAHKSHYIALLEGLTTADLEVKGRE